MIGDAEFVGYFHGVVFVADTLRCLCIVLGAIEIGLLLRLARVVRNTRQWGIYGTICVYFSVVLTEMDQLGHVLTMRLLLNVAGLTFGAIYLKKMNYHIDLERAKGRRDVAEQLALQERQLKEGIEVSLPKKDNGGESLR